jgi:hypothetical protein
VADGATVTDPWPPDLIAKARRFLVRGHRYSEGPREALVDTEHDAVVTRAELEAMDAATIAARLSRPATGGLSIGFRGPR